MTVKVSRSLLFLLVLGTMTICPFLALAGPPGDESGDGNGVGTGRDLDEAPWPMYGHGPSGSGSSPHGIADNPGKMRWNFYAWFWASTPPTVGPDHMVYTGSKDGFLYATRTVGEGNETSWMSLELVWRFETADEVHSRPVLASDGTIYFGSRDHHLYALAPDGSMKWRFQTGGPVGSSPAIAPDGTIYFGSDDHYLYAIDPDGTLKWRFGTGYRISSSPAIGSDGTVYFGSHDHFMYAIDPDGSMRWGYMTGGPVTSSPVIDPNGTVYFTSMDDHVYALSPSGAVQWAFDVEVEEAVTPAIGPDGTIYVRCGDIYAININGTLKWSYRTSIKNWATPLVGSDGLLYFGGDHLYAFYPNGTMKWDHDVEYGRVISPPALGKNDFVLFSAGGIVQMLRPEPRWPDNPEYRKEGAFGYPHAGDVSPVIASDGTIYFGVNGNLSALTPEGELKWRKEVSGSKLYPTIGPDGTIHIVESSGILTAMDPDGRTKWEFGLDVPWPEPPIIGPDGTVYLVDNSRYGGHVLYAIGQNGTLLWTFSLNGSFSMPAMGANGTIFIGFKDYESNQSSLCAIAPNGTLSWKWDVKKRLNPIKGGPTVAPDGMIYFMTWEGGLFLYSFEPDGRMRWVTTIGGRDSYDPAIGPDGTIYVTSDSLYWGDEGLGEKVYLHAVAPNGTRKWKTELVLQETEEMLYSYHGPRHPTVGSDGIVLVPTKENLVATNPDGTIRWSFDLPHHYLGQATIGADGTIYLTSSRNILYAIGSPPPIPQVDVEAEITTKDITIAYEDEAYLMDYNVADFDAPPGTYEWTLMTNASWLGISGTTGLLSGVPQNEDVGIYHVNVSVRRSSELMDFHEFILEVANVNDPPIVEIISPEDRAEISKADAWAVELRGTASDVDRGDEPALTWFDNGKVVARGSNATVTLEEGKHWIVLWANDGKAVSEDSVLVKVKGAQRPEVTSSDVVVGALAVLTLPMFGLLVAYVVGSETGRYKALLLLAPMFTKIKREALLDNFTRGKIYQYIVDHPGTHIARIRKEIRLNNGAVTFHLNKLEGEGYVLSQKSGMRRCYFPSDMRLPSVPSIQERLLSVVRTNPGISQMGIAKELDISSSTVNDYVLRMRKARLLKVVRKGRRTRCYLVENNMRKKGSSFKDTRR